MVWYSILYSIRRQTTTGTNKRLQLCRCAVVQLPRRACFHSLWIILGRTCPVQASPCTHAVRQPPHLARPGLNPVCRGPAAATKKKKKETKTKTNIESHKWASHSILPHPYPAMIRIVLHRPRWNNQLKVFPYPLYLLPFTAEDQTR